MTTYTYTVSIDFDTNNLLTNITNSSIIITQLYSINLAYTTLSITFIDPLSAGELTELDYLVNNNTTIINQSSSSDTTQTVHSVRVASIIGGTLSTSFSVGEIIDGITLAKNDSILIKNQFDAIENGIYSVGLTGPTRTIINDNKNAGGHIVVINQGITNANTLWICTNIFGEDIVSQYPLYFSRYGNTASDFYASTINTANGMTVGGTVNSNNIVTNNLEIKGNLIVSGGVGITGITGRATYSLVGNQLVATSTTYNNIAFFPWKKSLYDGTKKYTNGTIILNSTISNRDLLCEITEGITLTLLGGPTTITSSGTTSINFTNPIDDTYIIVSIKKNTSGGTSPIINGINIEFDMI